jgi:hypothetical protein
MSSQVLGQRDRRRGDGGLWWYQWRCLGVMIHEHVRVAATSGSLRLKAFRDQMWHSIASCPIAGPRFAVATSFHHITKAWLPPAHC